MKKNACKTRDQGLIPGLGRCPGDRNGYLLQYSCLKRSHGVQFSSVTQPCPTLCDPMDCSTPDLPIHPQLLELIKLMSTESVMSSNHLILCRPLLLLPPISPSIRVFSNESALCMKWPKYWSFSFSINPSNEYSGLIFYSIDWFDLLAVQGTPKSLLWHHSCKASALWCPDFLWSNSHIHT